MSFKTKALLSATALCAAAAVFAQSTSGTGPTTAPCPKGAPCAMQRGAKMGEGRGWKRMTPEQRQARFDEHIAQQAQALQITAAQRPQWDAYVGAKRQAMNEMGQMREEHMKNRDAFAKMTPDQRAEMHASRMEAMAKQMRHMAGVSKNLRDVLTPAQQTQFDQMAWGRGGMHGGMRHHGKHRGDMGGQGMVPPPAKP